MPWPTACRCCPATASATSPRRWAPRASGSGATATCWARRASSWPRPARTPPCWCARSTCSAASTSAGSGRSCATAGSTPTATCSSATSTDAAGPAALPHDGSRRGADSTPEMTTIDALPESAPESPLTDQPLRVVERDGVRYTLLGTAHVSQASIEAVRAAVASGEYDAVAVELDPGRLQSLTDPDVLTKMDIVQLIRNGKTSLFAANLALSACQRRLAEQLGVEPGAELKAAVLDARERGLPVQLIDREVGLTFRDRKSTRLNSSHVKISYAVFCLKKKNTLTT